LAAPSCLAFQDVELSTDNPAGPSAQQAGACPGEEGQHNCVLLAGEATMRQTSLRLCRDGVWSEVTRCEASQHCSAELGACVACEPGEQYRCEGTQLQVCSANGTDYRLEKDCALEPVNKLCDTRIRANDCFECINADQICDGDGQYLLCSGNRFATIVDCDDFGIGCVSVEDGKDYCSDCSTVGQYHCGVNSRLEICNAGYVYEPVQECASCRVNSVDNTFDCPAP
jgi:hypothetical protein